jgi:hypothetical protein
LENLCVLGVDSITRCYSDSATPPGDLSPPDPVVVLESEEATTTTTTTAVVGMFVVLGVV